LRLFRFLFARESYAGETAGLPRRFRGNDQGDVLHLLARGHILVVEIRTVRDFERDGAKSAEAAEDRLLVLAKTLLDVRPVAGVAERLFVSAQLSS
jgi:hypothetical protein